MTQCPCFFCEYQKWTEKTQGLHRQYHITNDVSCVISRTNSNINQCDILINESMNDETYFNCIFICDLLESKQYEINKLKRIKNIYLTEN